MLEIDDDIVHGYFKASVNLDMEFCDQPVPTNNEDYIFILSLTTDAVALILGEMKINPYCHCYWRFQAVMAIIKSQGLPMPASADGKITKNTLLTWGVEHHFIDGSYGQH